VIGFLSQHAWRKLNKFVSKFSQKIYFHFLVLVVVLLFPNLIKAPPMYITYCCCCCRCCCVGCDKRKIMLMRISRSCSFRICSSILLFDCILCLCFSFFLFVLCLPMSHLVSCLHKRIFHYYRYLRQFKFNLRKNIIISNSSSFSY